MTFLDSLFFSVFQYYKPKYKAKANDFALFYILIVQASVLLCAGAFLIFFLNQMQVYALSTSKAWTLFIIAVIILLFRNWMYYTGKKRKVLNTKSNSSKTSTQTIWLLWIIPIGILALSLILLQRL